MKIPILIIMFFAQLLSYSQEISKNGCLLVPRDLNAYNPRWIAYELVYPVNHGSMDGYIDAQPFKHYNKFVQRYHLGADISSPEPGDEDLGDTIYSIGRGKVVTIYGRIIMIMHKTKEGYIVSQYRHCMQVFVTDGQYIEKAQPIGRIGNEDGIYLAHLHFEIRTDINLDIEGGYGDPTGYVDPMKFIEGFNKKQ